MYDNYDTFYNSVHLFFSTCHVDDGIEGTDLSQVGIDEPVDGAEPI